MDTLWIRVAVYAGETDAIDETQPASVTKLGATDGPKPARRVTAPLQGDPLAASVNLYYSLPGTGATLRPGERVLVELPLKTREKGLVVPEAAVLYDIQIARHAGDRAVVSRGISEGAKVVTAGAAELFGTEFGAGH